MKEYMKSAKEKLSVYRHQLNYNKDKSSWRPTTKIVICRGVGKDKNGKSLDWCFATNQRGSLRLVWIYKKRWNIETGFRVQDEARIKSKSSNHLIRFFYHLVSMLLIIMWRLNNYIKGYLVIKRFLRFLEHSYTEVSQKPPDLTDQCGAV